MSAGYGSYDQFHAEGMLNGPLTDGVSARLSVLRNKADGYYQERDRSRT